VVSWAKSLRQKVATFQQTAASFPQMTEKIMGGENFNFVPIFSQKAVFSLKFCVFGRTFLTRRRFFNWLKYGGANCLPLPRFH